jgi:hypothetical protein
MMYGVGQIFIVYAALTAVAFLFHVVWERMHIRFYTNYNAMKGRLPVVINATIGDVMYTLAAVLILALVSHDPLWFSDAGMREFALLAVFGFCIALFVEYKAMRLKRWEYLPAMPRLFGYGLSPLLQMTVLLPLSVYSTMLVVEFILSTMPV